MTTEEKELVRHLYKYVNSEYSLRQFMEWFHPFSWDIHLWAPHVAEKTYEVCLFWMEHTSGVWTEVELKEKLGACLTRWASNRL